jgi:hypothetical protein
MLHTYLDHIAITAPTLAEGVRFVERTLGVRLRPGGAHPRMGTHNYLLRLGAKCYLEVIAVDPDAPPPNRPRWFDLDAPDPQHPIRLATWIARTDDIDAAVDASPIPLGEVTPMRRGQWEWRITIPADGRPPLDGVAPCLIQWTAGGHPADRLPDSGCALVGLEGFHPTAPQISGLLEAIGFEGDFRINASPPGARPYLAARIRTPAGVRLLQTDDGPRHPPA